jgi:TatD DNase family protein
MNLNMSDLVKQMIAPSSLYNSIPDIKGSRLPLCHTAMIPWVAEFTAGKFGDR